MREDYYNCRYAGFGDEAGVEALYAAAQNPRLPDIHQIFHFPRWPEKVLVCTYEGREIVGALHFSFHKKNWNDIAPCSWVLNVHTLEGVPEHIESARRHFAAALEKPWVQKLMPQGPNDTVDIVVGGREPHTGRELLADVRGGVRAPENI